MLGGAQSCRQPNRSKGFGQKLRWRLNSDFKRKVLEGYALVYRDTANAPHVQTLRGYVETFPHKLGADLID